MQRGVVALLKKGKKKGKRLLFNCNEQYRLHALMSKFSLPFFCKPHKNAAMLKLLFLTASPENKNKTFKSTPNLLLLKKL